MEIQHQIVIENQSVEAEMPVVNLLKKKPGNFIEIFDHFFSIFLLRVFVGANGTLHCLLEKI